jgi:hypothetical protein
MSTVRRTRCARSRSLWKSDPYLSKLACRFKWRLNAISRGSSRVTPRLRQNTYPGALAGDSSPACDTAWQTGTLRPALARQARQRRGSDRRRTFRLTGAAPRATPQTPPRWAQRTNVLDVSSSVAANEEHYRVANTSRRDGTQAGAMHKHSRVLDAARVESAGERCRAKERGHRRGARVLYKPRAAKVWAHSCNIACVVSRDVRRRVGSASRWRSRSLC